VAVVEVAVVEVDAAISSPSSPLATASRVKAAAMITVAMTARPRAGLDRRGFVWGIPRRYRR
jgi:hypothetical protein